MKFFENPAYKKDLIKAIESTLGIDRLKKKRVMLTGATGLIGSFLVDMLVLYNQQHNSEIEIYALGRSADRLKVRFGETEKPSLHYVEHDVNHEIAFDFPVDYLIHAASNAYPAVFHSDPVGTLMSNVMGTKRLLDYARQQSTKRFLFVSSGEVYGQGDAATDSYSEEYSGYIDPLQPRACYPVSKRAAETLCVSYTKQYGLDTVIVRPCHTYGPNATSEDNRANVQFVNNALNGEDIVLNSAGQQLRSYCYVADCASAILSVLINGKTAEAYNIANPASKVTIAEFAAIVAAQQGKKVLFLNPDAKALEERTPIQKQVLCTKKLEDLGWTGRYSVEKGVEQIFKILKYTGT
ncbi:MAG: NAD-dependent epimerase/dehydratase family protein [Oscillospiraceae bacterium]|nr:NAD-dependent epimerase/dehydratase family protein [Oscillospiraceae bacterium]